MKKLLHFILLFVICACMCACNTESKQQTNLLKIKNVSLDIPEYWKEENSKNGCLRYYAERKDGGLTDYITAGLEIEFKVDDDPKYDVSFDGLSADNENMIKVIERKYTDANVLTHEVFESNHGVKGILYKFSLNQNISLFEEKAADGYCFCFASETDRRWYYITMIKNDDVKKYDYENDYMDMIASINCSSEK